MNRFDAVGFKTVHGFPVHFLVPGVPCVGIAGEEDVEASANGFGRSLAYEHFGVLHRFDNEFEYGWDKRVEEGW